MSDGILVQLWGAYTALRDQITWPVVLWSVAILVPTWICYKIFVKPFLSPLRDIPGFPYIPIMGNMKEIFSGESMVATINALKKYGLVSRYYFFGGSERVIVGDPEAMKHILVTNCKNYTKPKGRMMLMRKVLGDGLVTSEGAKHARHKKLMSPAFNQNSILKMMPIFNAYTRDLVQMYKEKITAAGGSDSSDKNFHLQLPFLEDMSRLTLDIIGKAAFGYEFHSTRNEDDVMSKTFTRMISGQGASWKMVIPFHHLLPFKELRQLNNDVNMVHQKIQTMVDFKAKLQKHQGSAFVPADLLDMMMCARDETGQGMTSAELIDEVITIMGAGHETTAVALSWCMYALTNHPEIQERAREEVFSVLSSHSEGEDISLEQVDQMEFISAICKETLRFYPSVPVTLRQAVEDDVLCGYKIPKDTILLLAQGPMMRMPNVVEDAEVFNPERWMHGRNLDLYVFLPFLLGPRMCLGYKFALIEMKLILIYLLRNFRFESVPGMKYKRKSGGITMRPIPSLELRVSLVQ